MAEQSSQQEQQQEVPPQGLNQLDGGLGQRFSELEKYVKGEAKDLRDDAKDQRQIIFFGFIIILLMIAFYLLQAGYQLITSYNELQNSVIRLEAEHGPKQR